MTPDQIESLAKDLVNVPYNRRPKDFETLRNELKLLRQTLPSYASLDSNWLPCMVVAGM